MESHHHFITIIDTIFSFLEARIFELETLAPPHLAPSRKSSQEANAVNRKLHKRCSFESKWSLSSKFRAEVKLSLQKKAVTEQVALPPLTVCHWPRRIWLSWQDHFKCSFSSPLPRWPAAPQLPWEAGWTHPSEFALRRMVSPLQLHARAL